MGIVETLSGLGFWNWFFLAIVLFALETFIPGVHFLWFGLAAAIVGALAMGAAPGGYAEAFSWPVQLVLFALIAVVTVFLVKRFARPETAKSDEPGLNVRGSEFIGRVVRVEDAIVSGRGKVRAGDTIWQAQGEDAQKGASVRVTGVNGTSLVVERVGA